MKVKVEFTEAQMAALSGLIDNGVKATGLRCVRDAAEILNLLDVAIEKATKERDNERILEKRSE